MSLWRVVDVSAEGNEFQYLLPNRFNNSSKNDQTYVTALKRAILCRPEHILNT